jgi:hypothetical protein
MSNDIVIELDDETVDALKAEYGELLSVDDLVKEIVLNDLKHRGELKSLIEETKILNVGAAKLNSTLGQYDQLVKHIISKTPLPEPETTEAVEALTMNVTDKVEVEDKVTGGETVVQVGMDVQKVSTPPPTKPTETITNQLLDGNTKLDPKVKEVMDEVRRKNKEAAKHVSKGGKTAHTGGIVG